jgi:hypothetical protein
VPALPAAARLEPAPPTPPLGGHAHFSLGRVGTTALCPPQGRCAGHVQSSGLDLFGSTPGRGTCSLFVRSSGHNGIVSSAGQGRGTCPVLAPTVNVRCHPRQGDMLISPWLEWAQRHKVRRRAGARDMSSPRLQPGTP